MTMRYRPLLGVAVFLVGSVLLTISVLFLTICVGGLLVGGGCTVVLHWPTILPAFALILVGAFMIARSLPPRVRR